MTCCTYKCTGGKDCPVRERAYHKAAEKHFRPDYPLHVVMFDAPGNSMDDFARWWGNRTWWEQAGYVFGIVGACCLTAWWIVGPK